MTFAGIDFREGTATGKEIQAHLEECDTDFVPNLSSKVNIEEYARKIKSLAKTFEAWSGETLIGLVAAYMNDARTRTCFITSVSVAKEFMGQGIAHALLDHCFTGSRQEGMNAIRLEVSVESHRAIRFYKNFGFSETARNGDTVSMELETSEKRQS